MSPKYKLTYFKAKGRAEPIRILLAYGKQDFEDIYIERDKWPQIKPTMPLGKVPVLEVDGKVYHQSNAICRYLAKKFGLAGSNDEESLQMDIVADTLEDCAAELRKFIFMQDEKEKEALKKKFLAEIFPYYVSKLEEIVKANGGYFVNGKVPTHESHKYRIAVTLILIGPVKYHNVFSQRHVVINPRSTLETLRKLSWIDIRFATDIGSITSRMQGLDVLEKYPALKSLQKKVFQEPNIKAWLSKREPVE